MPVNLVVCDRFREFANRGLGMEDAMHHDPSRKLAALFVVWAKMHQVNEHRRLENPVPDPVNMQIACTFYPCTDNVGLELSIVLQELQHLVDVQKVYLANRLEGLQFPYYEGICDRITFYDPYAHFRRQPGG